ncbi:MAG: hypothetical protein AAF915_22315 [Cyanobacteria bacterium P01_D01_bin.50]
MRIFSPKKFSWVPVNPSRNKVRNIFNFETFTTGVELGVKVMVTEPIN